MDDTMGQRVGDFRERRFLVHGRKATLGWSPLLLAVGGALYGIWSDLRNGYQVTVLHDITAMQQACRTYVKEGRAPVELLPAASCAIRMDLGLFTEYVIVLDENYDLFARGNASPFHFAPSSSSFDMYLIRDGDVSLTPLDVVPVSW